MSQSTCSRSASSSVRYRTFRRTATKLLRKGVCHILVLSRKTDEVVVIGGNIKVTVIEIREHSVRLGFEILEPLRDMRYDYFGTTEPSRKRGPIEGIEETEWWEEHERRIEEHRKRVEHDGTNHDQP